MSKIKLTGSNSGYVEISSAADAGNLTLNLPTSGTALLSNGDNVYTGITTFSNDLKLEGGSYDVLWDSSDNQLEFGDNAKISFGASSDLQIFHDGNNSFINEVGSGSLYVRAQNTFNLQKAGTSDFMLKTTTDGAVELYFANSKKFETTNTGAIVTGICTATSFSGSGEGLTRTTQLSHRNKIINGAMNICQRATTQNTISLSGYYVADRFRINMVNVGSFRTNLFQSIQSPDGFNNSLGVSIGTGTAGAIASSERVSLEQRIESQDLQDLSFGTSAAKSFTLSFYVKSTRAGQYGINMRQHDSGKDYNEKFDISSANTWERKTITVSGNTGDTFADDNGIGLWFRIMLRAGVNSVGNVNYQSWGSSDADKAPTGQQTTWGTDVNDEFFLTGVQLEVGSVATPFEHRSFAEELRRCQRYYEGIIMGTGTALFRTWTNTAGSPTNVSNAEYHYKVEKRVTPTWSLEGNATWYPSGTSGMSAYPSTSTCLFQRNDTTHQFLADGVGDLCGSFSAEL